MIKLLLVLSFLILPFQTKNSQKEWLEQVNELRDEVNAHPLKTDIYLTYQCLQYAKKMVRTKRFQHDPNLSNKNAENIAMSTDANDDPIEMWKNSAGHYRNMVNKDFKRIGIAKASNSKETYWVMRLR